MENFDTDNSTQLLNPKVIALSKNFLSGQNDIRIFGENTDYNLIGKQLTTAPSIELTSKRASLFYEGSIEKFYLDKIKSSLHFNDYYNESDCYQNMAFIEREIWKSNMCDETKAVLLSASAVGKYSWSFWNKYLGNINLQCDTKYKSKQEIIIELLDADIEGTISGAIAGAILGSIYGSVLLPGLGTISAAIAECIHGGIYGALIGSGIKGVSLLIKYLKE